MALRINSFCVKDPKDPRTTRPHQLPIYATSSFEFESIEEGMEIFRHPEKGHLYARFANPTVDAVAKKIADLECHGLAIDDGFGIMTSSGMSAISTMLMSLCKKGDKILTQGNLYGGTTELIKKVFPNLGIEPVWVDLRNAGAVEEKLEKEKSISAIYFETPSNPALDCIDIETIAKLGRRKNIPTIVDNTFCTPVIQQPFKYDVDYVIHSTTKYLNGHGNGISGVIVGRGEEARRMVWSVMKLIGTNCNPFDAWLTNTGMKTLAIRMERHCTNALALAQFLEDHPMVASVRYLGLPSHENHTLAKKQMEGFGGMICFEVKGGYDAGLRFMNRNRIGSLAPTMGDVDTLILHPASMSHLNVDREVRLANGITDNLIRVSVGIEDIEDLKEDFDRALS